MLRNRRPSGRAEGVPRFVERALRSYLGCGRLAHGFARFRCATCRHDRLVAFSCKSRGVCPSCAGRRMTERAADLVDRVLPRVRHRQWVLSLPYWLRWRMAWDHALALTVLKIFVAEVFAHYRIRAHRRDLLNARTGSVTVIQRFGSALNLNVHFHTLVPDGVWTEDADGRLAFHPLDAPTAEELERIAERIAYRTREHLVAEGLWEDDEDGGRPLHADDPPALSDVYERSVLQRDAEGRRLPRIGVRMPLDPGTELGADRRRRGAFDLYAGVVVGAKRRERLECLCRYLLRPSLSADRLTLLPDGDVLLKLKTRWSDGTTHLRLTPHQLLDRLAALIPRPQTNEVVYHGVLAANASWRSRIVPDATPARPRRSNPKRPNHRWAELMRRGLELDVLRCPQGCATPLKLIALIERPAVVRAILIHLGLPSDRVRTEPARAPPAQDAFDWAS
ncbi:MAG TPA: transposase [Sandaracinaceae bacterium LLY-WYZ-13_1]|nr:transposase [Sandaracinaceae bacterium LLY-WYZ-13_1]